MPRAQRCIIGSSNKKQVVTQLPPFPKNWFDHFTYIKSGIPDRSTTLSITTSPWEFPPFWGRGVMKPMMRMTRWLDSVPCLKGIRFPWSDEEESVNRAPKTALTGANPAERCESKDWNDLLIRAIVRKGWRIKSHIELIPIGLLRLPTRRSARFIGH